MMQSMKSDAEHEVDHRRNCAEYPVVWRRTESGEKWKLSHYGGVADGITSLMITHVVTNYIFCVRYNN